MRADRAHGAGAAVPRHVADVCGAPATTAAAVRSAVSGDVSHMPTARVRFSAGVQCAPREAARLFARRFLATVGFA